MKRVLFIYRKALRQIVFQDPDAQINIMASLVQLIYLLQSEMTEFRVSSS